MSDNTHFIGTDATISTADHRAQPTTISQPWLQVLRVAWVILAVLAVAILFASIPGYILYLQGESYTTEILPNSSLWFSLINLATALTSFFAALLSLVLT